METTSLILRRPEKEDFERFFEINKDPQTNLYNPSGPMSFAKAENMFKKMMGPLGTVSFWRLDYYSKRK
jgi:ribosomal-protein-alanine N-acetyltransferase